MRDGNLDGLPESMVTGSEWSKQIQSRPVTVPYRGLPHRGTGHEARFRAPNDLLGVWDFEPPIWCLDKSHVQVRSRLSILVISPRTS